MKITSILTLIAVVMVAIAVISAIISTDSEYAADFIDADYEIVGETEPQAQYSEESPQFQRLDQEENTQ